MKADHRTRLLEKLPKKAVCAEIGVWKGEFSQRILNETEPKLLHLIDPWQFQPDYKDSWYGNDQMDQQGMDDILNGVKNRFEEAIEKGKVSIHRAMSEEAAREFEDAYFDWVYIDGNHTYEYVKKDILSFLPKVKSGGIIAGDDYQSGGWWEGGVKKAVDELIDTGILNKGEVFGNQFLCYKK